MIDLTKLLERFTKSLSDDSHTKSVVIDVIENYTRVRVQPENINLKDGVLEISTTPIIKSEISLKENMIKTDLKERYKIYFSRIIYK